MRHFQPYILVLAVLLIWLPGCSASEDSASSKQERRDELILAVGGEPDTGFDPTTGWGRYGSPLFQSTLLRRNSKMEIETDLATNYRISPDGKVWSLDIRRDAVFSDGEAVTAEDVVYTFEAAKQSNSIVDLTNLESIEAIDEYAVRITLKQPQSTFIHILESLGIVPEHVHDATYARQPIGSGPYQFVQWDKGQQLIVERNPKYYGDAPYFSKITFLFLNEDAAFAAAKAGTVDIAYIPSSFANQQVRGMRMESLRTVDNRGIMFPYVPSGSTTEEGVSFGNDVTADLAIRQAINIAIDRKALVEGILEGHGTPAYSIHDGLPWWSPENVIEDGNVAKAKERLEQGGWVDQDGDGIVEKDGLKAQFTLLYPASDGTRQSLAIATADMLQPIGIDVRAEGKSWDEIQNLMHSNPVVLGWGSLDPLEMYYVHHSRFAGVDYYNPGYYSNPKVDEYMNQAMAAVDEEQAIAYWKKAQWDGTTGISAKGDAPWAWLVNVNHLYLVNENLDIGKQRTHPHGHGWPITANIEEWKWLE